MHSRSRHSTLRFAGVVGVFITALLVAALAWGPQAAVCLFLGTSAIAYGRTVTYSMGAALTMLDIAKLNGNDKVVGLIEENLKFAPEVAQFPMRTIKGTSYKTGIRTALPTTAFRGANEGQTPSKSTFVNRLVEAYIFGGQIEVDKAVADAHEDGAEALQAIEALGVMQSAMQKIGSQIWYGVSTDAKGFPGAKAATVFGASTAVGDALTINATGATASTASSVYAVKFGDQHSTLIGGNNKAWELDPFTIQQIVAANSGKLTAYVAGLTGWIGLQIAHENCVRRIANLTAETNKGLTDALLAQLLATFPIGFVPDAIFMSRRSRTQLQTSRSVVLQGNAKVRPDQPVVAPIPTEYDGVPIFATDSILNTDAIEA